MQEFLTETSLSNFEFVGSKELETDSVRLNQWKSGLRVCYSATTDDTLVFVLLEEVHPEPALFELFKKGSAVKESFGFRGGKISLVGVTDQSFAELEEWVRPIPGLSVLQLTVEFTLHPNTSRYLMTNRDVDSDVLPAEQQAEPQDAQVSQESSPNLPAVAESNSNPKQLSRWLKIVCYECEQPAEVGSFLVLDHLNRLGRACSASGSPGRLPDTITSNVPHTCARCGAETSSHAKSGMIYSHKLPGTRTVCEASRTYTEPQVKTVVISKITKSEYQGILAQAVTEMRPSKTVREGAITSPSPSLQNEYPDRSTRSIYAFNGGSPGAGRR